MSKNIFYGLIVQLVLINLLLATGLSKGQDNELSEHKNQYKSLKSIDLQNVPASLTISEAFDLIQEETGLTFSYLKGNVPLQLSIRVSSRNKSLYDHLMNISRQAELSFRRINNKIVVKTLETKSEQAIIESYAVLQQNTIQGKVLDARTGEPLVGATVQVKGTTLGAITDVEGNYSLEVPDDAEYLLFSFIGFQIKEQKINDQSIINAELFTDSYALTEVVVTALNFETNTKNLGYSISKVEGDQINTVQTPSIVNNLSGKVAGVDVGNISNGVAGSKRVIIRGASSLTGDNQPLWVVDGVPINSTNLGTSSAYGGIDYGDGLTGINAEDVENISVLKGNAAAALYGSRASNGVILVTTKSGRNLKDKINIDFSSSVLFDNVVDLSDHQKEYGQSSRVNINQRPIDQADAFGSGSWGAKLDGVPTVQFDGVERPYSAVDDNYKKFFRTGTTITNTISISGKSDVHNYRISLSDLRNTDVVPNANFNRTGINVKTSSSIGKLKADIVLNYIYEAGENRPFIGGNVSNLFYSLAYLPANLDVETLKPGYNPDGSEFTYADFINNPYFIINKDKEEDIKNRLIGSLSLQYDFTDHIYLRGRFTRDYYNFRRLSYTPDGVLYRGYLDGELDQRSRESFENNYELILGTQPFGFDHFKISGFFGGNINQRTTNQIVAEGNSFVVPGVYSFNNLRDKYPSTSQYEQQTNSLFGNLEFNFHDYLFLTLTGRNDWFSTLPLDNNNLFYPSAALSFVFTDAFSLPQFINFGKLRLSSAQVSGDTGPYQLDLSYALQDVQYNSLSLQTIGTSNIPNRNLKPLLSTDYEIGFQLEFLNSRLGIDLAYYKKTTKNDIIRTAVSVATGYSSAILNVGEMQKSGLEMLLNIRPISRPNFTWDMTTTFSINDNKVMALGDGVNGAPIELAASKNKEASIKVVEGEPYGQIFGIGYQRDDNGNKVYDSQGFPVRTSEQVLLGNANYRTLLGFNNTFNWKDFSFNFLIDAKFGADIFSESNAIAVANGTHKMTLEGRENGIVGVGVTESGEANTVSVPAEKINSYYNRISSIAEEFIYDASFVKLRELSISYQVPAVATKRIGIRNASVSLVGRNLLTLYKATENIDPESNLVSGNAQGIERFGYPSTINYGFVIKLGM
ncbi:MAG: SusC/RagA family TonB-linked outer membrane protein [Cyclobacteriaceae bacterium]|nr:SusC/RagA family TonB-linked outer membrane protein [Cyclobacteriaceae bacterium]